MMSQNQKEILKKINARTQKWRIMLSAGIHKDETLLKSRVRKGIPSGMRMQIWPQLVNLKSFINQSSYNYQKLINSFSNNIYEISLDIPRTFPEQQDSKYLQKSLNNILKAISIIYPQVGYCQGMNFFAIRLLEVLNDETAFWLLHYLFEKDPNLRKHYSDPKTLEKQSYIFEQLAKQKITSIQKYFKQTNVFTQAYTVRWFMTLYSGCLRQQLFNRIFEVYLIEGWSIMHAVGLSLLKNKQQKILKNNYQQNFFLLGAQLFKVDDNDTFLNLAYSMDISKSKIDQLGNKYDNINLSKPSQIQRKSKRNQELGTRQQNNKKYKFQVPQNQTHLQLNFQNHFQELNFELLSSLKKNKS